MKSGYKPGCGKNPEGKPATYAGSAKGATKKYPKKQGYAYNELAKPSKG